MKSFLYKFKKSVIPTLTLTLSVGMVYAFSLFTPHLMEVFNVTKMQVLFAFTLSIFFLGTGASCFGQVVEKNIKKASVIGTSLFCSGLLLSQLIVNYYPNIWLFYITYGCMVGLGTGIIYVTPVKNLILWFGKSKHKALIMAISIVTFGLGSSLCSYLFKYSFPYFGITGIFYFLGLFYLMMMSIGTLLINKPRYALMKIAKDTSKVYSLRKYITDSYFLRCWLFMFLNISMGLIIIGQCAGMLTSNGLSNDVMLIVMMLCGFSNGFGRLLFPAISDYMKNRIDILLITLIIEIAIFMMSIWWIAFIPAAFIIVNATYGSFFANLPAVLMDHYGKSELSYVHGLVLQAWASAALFAFIISSFVLNALSLSQNMMFVILIAAYSLNFVNVLSLRK